LRYLDLRSSMDYIFSSGIEKKIQKLPTKTRNIIAERLRVFASDPHHPILNNHGLQGKRKHQRSINVSGDLRLIFEPVNNNLVKLIDVDTHHNLYGK
jgi:mRNA-degrading endonuclease YafQ of YafQ-DinJ toxin-antitoxin module